MQRLQPALCTLVAAALLAANAIATDPDSKIPAYPLPENIK